MRQSARCDILSTSYKDASVASGTWSFAENTWNLDTNEKAIEETTLTNASAVAASLTLTGKLKYATGYVQSSKASNKTVNKPEEAAAYFTLTLTKPAKVSLTVTGGGTAEAARFVALTKASGDTITTILSKGSLVSSPTDELKTSEQLDAGTYKIYFNGSRIWEIALSN